MRRIIGLWIGILGVSVLGCGMSDLICQRNREIKGCVKCSSDQECNGGNDEVGRVCYDDGVCGDDCRVKENVCSEKQTCNERGICELKSCLDYPDVCEVGEKCDDGKCVKKICKDDPDICEKNERCNDDGVCVRKSCLEDPDVCYASEKCDEAGNCIKKSCKDDPAICLGSQMCNDAGECVNKSCKDDPAICLGGQMCNDEGECVAKNCKDDPGVCLPTEKCNDEGECVAKNCKDDALICSDRQYCSEEGACVDILEPDIDGDTVPDSMDKCKFNPEYNEGAFLKSCHTYNGTTHEYRVYNMANYLDLVSILNGNKPYLAEMGEVDSSEIEKVTLMNDLNLAGYDELVEKDNNGNCSVKNWESIKEHSGIVWDGNGHRIYARNGERRCSIPEALFDVVNDSVIRNIELDLDVVGRDALAILANQVNGCKTELSHINYRGSVINSNEDGINGVGGLVAVLFNEKDESEMCTRRVSHCWADGVAVEAPSSDSVGGMFGEIGDVVFIPSSDVNRIDIVKGKDCVGGMFGHVARVLQVEVDESSSLYVRAIVGDIVGQNNIGGYCGKIVASALEHVAISVNSVSGLSYVGGISGYGTGNDDIFVTAKRISGSNYVGGLAGLNSVGNIKNITVEVEKIESECSAFDECSVGGLFGSYSYYKADVSNVSVAISGIKKTGDRKASISCIGSAIMPTSSTMEYISCLANIYGGKDDFIGGGIASSTSNNGHGSVSSNIHLLHSVIATSRVIDDKCDVGHAVGRFMLGSGDKVYYYNQKAESMVYPFDNIENVGSGYSVFGSGDTINPVAPMGSAWRMRDFTINNIGQDLKPESETVSLPAIFIEKHEAVRAGLKEAMK